MIPIHSRKLLLGAISAILLTASGCSTGSNVQTRSASQKSALHTKTYIESLPVYDSSGRTWLPLEPAANSLGYRVVEEPGGGGYVKIGYSDVLYKVRAGSPNAFSWGKPCVLPDAPDLKNGKLYMTAAALSKLFHSRVSITPGTGEVYLTTPKDQKVTDHSTTKNGNESGQTGTAGRTGVITPKAAGEGSGMVQDSHGVRLKSESDLLRIQNLSSADAVKLVSYAKQFLGVPYEFGAAPYEESKTFDCSSFTRHVFKKFGKDLPRLAKDQDKIGQKVTRQQLETGDLIFFTVPGRFEKDTIPGHVGIYIGDGKFIHTWGNPGVQISELDSGYWNGVILDMRRVF
ncbi:C40 family peptidase [Paenibacillus sp. HN-1]|uniref:C40 family peptidase n=1 Tax=Paenibacillus TaxID=44249 RepID=UPI001CA9C9C2|nr:MULTISPECIES: C40 family peptidase [Paenibacillus]MBY9082267.1 C40 family peptidase [Paenibacillus sp. CGMCC 1.18879]MBY9086369.1 C40 family peptidase [Paenibacillus sinensis]